MLDSLKKIGLGGNKEKDKAGAPKVGSKPSVSTFGGMTSAQMKKQIDLAASGSGTSSLVQAQVGDGAKQSLENYSKPKETIKVVSSSSLAEDIATIYCEGDVKSVIDMLRQHLNAHKGAVDKRFWYMLMDSYQVSENKTDFEKVAISFAHLFGASPPSWFSTEGETKKTMMAGKNIIILEPTFKVEHTEKFKEFLKAAKEEKFCRINVSPCKFEQSDIQALVQLHKLFTDLRKYQVMSVLMGDNNLINFCKTYINPNPSNKALKPELLANEQLFWLLYLEILQWKGRQEEFENLALDYAMKFEISPPGWEPKGIMSIDKLTGSMADLVEEENKVTFDKSLNSNNIDTLLNAIKEGFESGPKAEIDLSFVERIDFAAAGSISHYIQELMNNEQHNDKKVIFKFPNEMILTLLEMVGVTEFVEVIPRKR